MQAKWSAFRRLTSVSITATQIGLINFIERHFPDGVEGMPSDERRRLLYQVHAPDDFRRHGSTHETSE